MLNIRFTTLRYYPEDKPYYRDVKKQYKGELLKPEDAEEHSINTVFLFNTYHRMENRVDHFKRQLKRLERGDMSLLWSLMKKNI